jgi:hypothetical protein
MNLYNLGNWIDVGRDFKQSIDIVNSVIWAFANDLFESFINSIYEKAKAH